MRGGGGDNEEHNACKWQRDERVNSSTKDHGQ